MELQQIMQRLNESRNAETNAIKTASSKTNKPSANPEALREALKSALTSDGQEKTAAATTRPTDDLLKMAADISNAEDAALQKQAQIYGAAMCDGFMTRFADYEDAASKTASTGYSYKTAATVDQEIEMIKTAANDPAFHKFANENPELVKEAYDLGYQNQWGALVKEAQDSFQQGYNDRMEQIHKVSSDCYKNGVIDINNVLKQL